jgi:host factor-I protein
VFLVNGIRLSGQLAGFDQFAVLLESGPGVQLVCKHAISTVMPVSGKNPARDPTDAPMSRDKPTTCELASDENCHDVLGLRFTCA